MAAKRRDRGKGAEGTESAAAAEAERKRICDIIDSFRYTGGGRIGDRESLVASDPGTETKPTAASAPVKSRARRSAFAAAPKPKATAKDRDKAKAKTKPKRRSTLTVAEKRLEAYLKVPPNFNFKPPRSRHRLLQEDHAFDPWRVIVLCMLLNVTTGSQVKKVVDDFFALCPNAETTIGVNEERIEKVVRSLGLKRTRSAMIKRLSEQYLSSNWTHVTQLPGVGKYAADAYAIFCTGKGADVRPEDHKLVDYWNSIYGNDAA